MYKCVVCVPVCTRVCVCVCVHVYVLIMGKGRVEVVRGEQKATQEGVEVTEAIFTALVTGLSL